jgi:hypothetical protein
MKKHEWSLLKEEFERLVRAEGARDEDIGDLLDAQFQSRLAELIEWALNRKGPAQRLPGADKRSGRS